MSSSRSSNAASLARHVVVGVLTAEHLEAEVGGGAPAAGHDVLVAGLHPGAEVHRVGIVQAHLGERSGAGLHERMVAVVVERQMRTSRNAAREVLQTLEQVGFGFDERCGGDQTLGLGDRVDQWLRVHLLKLERVLTRVNISTAAVHIWNTRYAAACPPPSLPAAHRRRPIGWCGSSTSSPAAPQSASGCPNWPAGSG